MNAKLTLTIEQRIIEKAKEYARQQGRSLSDIIENYLKIITSEATGTEPEMTPVTKLLRGSFKMPEGFDETKELSESLVRKYL